MIDNSNNEIRGGGVKRDAGGDEKQLIKFAWPNYCPVSLTSVVSKVIESIIREGMLDICLTTI